MAEVRAAAASVNDIDMRLAALGKQRKQLVKLAARGTPVGQIARILGVTDGAVSKALAEPKLAELVNDMRFTEEAVVQDQDSKLNRIQAKLVDKLEESIDLIHKPIELISAIEKLAKVPRRSTGETPVTASNQTTVVQLSLPYAAKQLLLQTNSQNQVVQAGDQTLVTMQSHEVARRFGPAATPALEVTATETTKPENRAKLINAADVESALESGE